VIDEGLLDFIDIREWAGVEDCVNLLPTEEDVEGFVNLLIHLYLKTNPVLSFFALPFSLRRMIEPFGCSNARSQGRH